MCVCVLCVRCRKRVTGETVHDCGTRAADADPVRLQGLTIRWHTIMTSPADPLHKKGAQVVQSAIPTTERRGGRADATVLMTGGHHSTTGPDSSTKLARPPPFKAAAAETLVMKSSGRRRMS